MKYNGPMLFTNEKLKLQKIKECGEEWLGAHYGVVSVNLAWCTLLRGMELAHYRFSNNEH